MKLLVGNAVAMYEGVSKVSWKMDEQETFVLNKDACRRL